MEIKIPKEVRDYHENIFFGLNTRQFICSVLAVGVAVGIYFALQPYVGTEEIGWVCILGAAPFAACSAAVPEKPMTTLPISFKICWSFSYFLPVSVEIKKSSPSNQYNLDRIAG